MNDLTNKIFTKVVDVAQTSSAITNVADKLLSHLLPQEKALADKCWTIACSGCLPIIHRKTCTLYCCGWGIPPCRNVFRTQPC